MSTKSTILLTDDLNEHWYEELSEYLETKDGRDEFGIILEISKQNFQVLIDDDDDLVIMLNNPDSDLYKELKDVFKKIRGY